MTKAKPTPVAQAVLASPFGALTLEASARGLRSVRWGRAAGSGSKDRVPVAARKTAAAAARQLHEYFAGRRRRFTLPLDLAGTPFQRAVWRRLLTIPYGTTASYAEVARSIGRPRACRAVGGANRSNPVAVIVPCHRVIGASGALVGYGGRSGVPLKRSLLELEAAQG